MLVINVPSVCDVLFRKRGVVSTSCFLRPQSLRPKGCRSCCTKLSSNVLGKRTHRGNTVCTHNELHACVSVGHTALCPGVRVTTTDDADVSVHIRRGSSVCIGMCMAVVSVSRSASGFHCARGVCVMSSMRRYRAPAHHRRCDENIRMQKCVRARVSKRE